jgi:hypothetical protein
MLAHAHIPPDKFYGLRWYGVFLQEKGESRAGETSTNDYNLLLRGILAVDFFFGHKSLD